MSLPGSHPGPPKSPHMALSAGSAKGWEALEFSGSRILKTKRIVPQMGD